MLLEEDARCGYRLKPNLDLPAGDLGFSLKSNSIGLRGPCDPEAGNVIFGTSYAMGIAVNNGENWHELCLPEKGWLNLGLAVGIREWGELLAMHHRGPKERAILLYHPNIWVHCLMYERWRNSSKGVFDALRWRTGWFQCAKLTFRKKLLLHQLQRTGNWLSVDHGEGKYEIDARYSLIQEAVLRGVFERNIAILISILSAFHSVQVIRLPVKQQFVPFAYQSKTLMGTIAQYELLWKNTCERLRILHQAEFHCPNSFELGHYHSVDTHWNANGNRYFSDWLKRQGTQ